MSVNKDTPEQVTIRPGIGLYALFPSLRYSPWVALGEMVDNSIQSYQEHKEELFALHGPEYKLRIEINYSSGYIQRILKEHLHQQCHLLTKRESPNTELA
jgi:hypothetical protein